MENKYKKENTLVERVKKSHSKIKTYYPERVPIIIQRYKNKNKEIVLLSLPSSYQFYNSTTKSIQKYYMFNNGFIFYNR